IGMIDSAECKAIYDEELGAFDALLQQAKAVQEAAERYVLFAKAEAALLESGVIVPTTTQGGNYALSRVAPRTMPYTFFGTDNEKFKHILVTDKIWTKAQRDAYQVEWAAERARLLA
ncbi:MAG: hypothetical protein M0P49_03685, partial [Bacilli bacterium]|nr:hypothetical protein [Bacilli bacterium]